MSGRRFRGAAPLALVVLILVGVPAAVLTYQSRRSGMTWSEIVGRSAARAGAGRTGLEEMAQDILPPAPPIAFLQPQPIGDPFTEPPKISYVEAVDLDHDGLLDVVVCDCQDNRVSWIRQHPKGEFREHTLAAGLVAPAHVQAVDFDKDGDLDLAVAVLGMLHPNNDRIGSVVVLENDGRQEFTPHVAAERIARVSDVRAADLDGDGDNDLAVAQFGYDDGETRWLENLGQWRFATHMLQSLSGPIHIEPRDFDQDGRLDLALLVSQEWEEIYVFRGDGRGGFQPKRIFGSTNEDFGSSGMWAADFDQDGDWDLIYANGDAFDYIPPAPRPWHGVQWLENLGGLNFTPHRIVNFPGAVNAHPWDPDHDGDLDLLVVSAYNFWDDPAAQSMIWLENDGRMRFRRRDLANTPTHIQALDLGDFDGDGQLDAVTGSLCVYPPYDRIDRVVLWRNRWAETAGSR